MSSTGATEAPRTGVGTGPVPGGSGAASAPPASANGNDPDWTDQVTDLVVETVDKVRARTTGRILSISHGAVYGLVALLVIIPVLVVAAIGFMRLLNWAIPGDVWIIYAIVAVLMWIVGFVLWTKRAARA